MEPIEFTPAGIYILVIGDVMLDRYVYGNVTRVSPEDPTCLVLEHQSPVERRVGGAANVALNLAAMGANVTLISLAGNGRYRDQFHGSLKYQLAWVGRTEDAIDVRLIESDRSFTVKTRYCFKDKQLLRVDHECRHPQTEAECAALVEAVEDIMDDIDKGAPQLTIVSDYAKGTIDAPLLDELLHKRQCRLKTNAYIVDPKRADLNDYGYPLVLCPNEHEIRDYNTRAHHLVVTCGMNGCVVYSHPGRKRVEIPSPDPVEICDPTGAGDSFIAALTLALAMKKDIKEACWIANIAGRLSVLHQGTHVVTQAAIEASLKEFAGPELRRE